MLSTLPKHKGTEKLQADLKRRLSKARKESHKKGASHSAPFYVVKKEGAGQVVLIGPPNSGKSQLVASLTHAHLKVADYPFATRVPTPGMMAYSPKTRPTDSEQDKRTPGGRMECVDLWSVAAGIRWPPQRVCNLQVSRPAGETERTGALRRNRQIRVS